MLRPFHVGKALTSHDGPWSWIRESRVAPAQESCPACHLTNAPLTEGHADLEQIIARRREQVTVTAPLRLGCHLDDAEAFELLEPLREEGAGESGRTLEDLAEGFTAQMQVADDQRRPTLGEDLRATGDRAVLAVDPDERSVSRLSTAVKSRFRTSKSR